MRQSQEIGSLEAASSAALADLYLIRINILYADCRASGGLKVSYQFYCKDTKKYRHMQIYLVKMYRHKG